MRLLKSIDYSEIISSLTPTCLGIKGFIVAAAVHYGQNSSYVLQ